jgi:ABC-type polysaccharide/polyol phosphate transport system ATPase subunit
VTGRNESTADGASGFTRGSTSAAKARPLTAGAIKLSSVGIKFFLNLDEEVHLRRDGIKAFRTLLRRTRKKEFWAVKDISLEIKKGEIFGIIGGNGAGKSTLLKIIAGIFPSSAGSIEVSGTLAPLIELGGAFNPELTGAENIYLTGSIYRIPRKVIRRNFDQIVDFSGIRKFIDIPIKNYSFGMFIRLAFSIIIFFQPDIVLIDEVFSVGDEVFQQKSFEKILSFKERGATIVLVSHDLNMISQFCGRVLVLSCGRTAFIGPAEEAVNKYHELLRAGEGIDTEGEARGEGGEGDGGTRERRGGELERDTRKSGAIGIGGASAQGASGDSRRWGNKKVEITRVDFVDKDGNFQRAFHSGDYFEARLSYVSRLVEDEIPVFGAAIHTAYKMLIYGPNTLESAGRSGIITARGVVRLIIPALPLFKGDYLFSASAYDQSLSVAYDHHDMMYLFRVLDSPSREFGCVKLQSHWEIEKL